MELVRVVPLTGVIVTPVGGVGMVTGMVWLAPSKATGVIVRVGGEATPFCRLQLSVAGDGLTSSAVPLASVVCTVAAASVAPAAKKVRLGVPVVKFEQPVVVDTVYVRVFAVVALRVCEVDGETTRPAGTVGTVTARVEVPESAVTGATEIVAEA